MANRTISWLLALLCVAAVAHVGCGGGEGTGAGTVRIEGSDTMVNLAQAWAERYHRMHPGVSVQVQGGGSGVGFASMTDGNCDIAASSREIRPRERERIAAQRGEPEEHIVGYDALAIYVNRGNPLEEITIEQLAEIYREGGTITRWSQLGGPDIEITRVSRQNNSGTYAYFREAVLGKNREYKLGSIDQSGSKDVVALVATTPGAIGYSGMGYATDKIKTLKVARATGEPAYAPTVENVLTGKYPITRPLYLYTCGNTREEVQKFIEWIESPEGQAIIVELGFVPRDRKNQHPVGQPRSE